MYVQTDRQTDRCIHNDAEYPKLSKMGWTRRVSGNKFCISSLPIDYLATLFFVLPVDGLSCMFITYEVRAITLACFILLLNMCEAHKCWCASKYIKNVVGTAAAVMRSDVEMNTSWATWHAGNAFYSSLGLKKARSFVGKLTILSDESVVSVKTHKNHLDVAKKGDGNPYSHSGKLGFESRPGVA